jgi:hypothetical protein
LPPSSGTLEEGFCTAFPSVGIKSRSGLHARPMNHAIEKPNRAPEPKPRPPRMPKGAHGGRAHGEGRALASAPVGDAGTDDEPVGDAEGVEDPAASVDVARPVPAEC